MDKVKVKVVRLDGTVLEAEGTPEQVAKVLIELDKVQMAPAPALPVLLPPTINPLPTPPPGYTPWVMPWAVPIWVVPQPNLVPYVDGWPITICQADTGASTTPI